MFVNHRFNFELHVLFVYRYVGYVSWQVARLEQKMDRFSQELEELRQTVRDLSGRLTQVQDENLQLRSIAQAADDRVDDVRVKLNRTDDYAVQIDRRLVAAENELKRQKQNITFHRKVIDEERKKVVKHVEKFQNKTTTFEERINTRFDRFNVRIQRIKQKIDSTEQTVVDYQSKNT